MATLLIIERDLVLRIARLETTNTTNQADADAVIADEQAAIEAALNPASLADASLAPLLTLGVAKLLAAELLSRIGREEGRTGTFQGLGLTLSQAPDHARALLEAAGTALAPHLRRVRAAQAPSSPSPAGRAAQERLLGKTEAER